MWIRIQILDPYWKKMDPNPGSQNVADPSINSHLMDMMQGNSEEGAAEDDGEDQRSPVKSKQKI